MSYVESDPYQAMYTPYVSASPQISYLSQDQGEQKAPLGFVTNEARQPRTTPGRKRKHRKTGNAA
jgi:hypothetical protein